MGAQASSADEVEFAYLANTHKDLVEHLGGVCLQHESHLDAVGPGFAVVEANCLDAHIRPMLEHLPQPVIHLLVLKIDRLHLKSPP